MDPIEACLMRLWARLAAENAALTALLAAGYALCEVEEMLWEEAMAGADRGRPLSAPEGNGIYRLLTFQRPCANGLDTAPI